MATEFGKILRIIRVKTGEDAETMAQKLHISKSYLTAIENGTRNIPDELITLLEESYPFTPEDRRNIKASIIKSTKILKINLDNYSETEKKIIRAFIEKRVSPEQFEIIRKVLRT